MFNRRGIVLFLFIYFLFIYFYHYHIIEITVFYANSVALIRHRVLLNSFDRSIFNRTGVGLLFIIILPCFREIPVLNANSVDPDQTSRSVASDMGLQSLPMSLYA